MLTFRNTSITFSLLLLTVAGIDLVSGVSAWLYLLLALVYFSILFYGSYYVGSNFFFRVICSAETSAKEIAISFDDGPSKSYTPEIAALLKEHEVPSAFFCIGHRIKGNEQMLRLLIEEGHMIGNHSYSHHYLFDLFSVKRLSADLEQMDVAMESATGLKPRLFRPPYGVTTPNLGRAVSKGNYIPVGWNVRSMDTVIKDEKKLLDKISRKIQPGAIFLFHDTSQATLAMLPGFISRVRAMGFRFVRLDIMLKLNAYA
jgi:peptidoglycan/xylan/chitin deacetylase (PgdA/CDA1 family)